MRRGKTGRHGRARADREEVRRCAEDRRTERRRRDILALSSYLTGLELGWRERIYLSSDLTGWELVRS